MRRGDKEIGDRAEIDAIVRDCQVCRLALAREGEPYLVPVSFGYDGESLYLHTAREGRKIGFFQANPRVCFQMERNVRLVTDEREACRWTFHFESVIGYGTIAELVDPQEKERGLRRIMEQYSGRRWGFAAPSVQSTRVWRIRIEEISGKRSGPKEL